MIFRRSIAENVSRLYGQVSHVSVIPLEGDVSHTNAWDRLGFGNLSWENFVIPVVAVVLALLATQAIQWFLPATLYRINAANTSLIFLFVCVVVSLRLGLLPGVLSSLLSFLVINYFYTVPIYRLCSPSAL